MGSIDRTGTQTLGGLCYGCSPIVESESPKPLDKAPAVQRPHQIPEPIRQRKRSTIDSRKPASDSRTQVVKKTRSVMILLVEDNEMVAGAVRETLEVKGWTVETCSDGTDALERIMSKAHYDLLLLDYELPGVNGLELVQRARQLDHHSRTPIIVLSATPIGPAALRTGANEFLPKPQGVSSLVRRQAMGIPLGKSHSRCVGAHGGYAIRE